MRESRLYLKFFWQNWWIIFGSTIITCLVVFYYLSLQPQRFTQSQLLQIDFTTDNVLAQQAIADQVVTVGRSTHLHQLLQLHPTTSVSLYKPGPLAINLVVESNTSENAYLDLAKINQWLNDHYPLQTIGQNIASQVDQRLVFYLSLATLAGIGLGIGISLVRSYFHSY